MRDAEPATYEDTNMSVFRYTETVTDGNGELCTVSGELDMPPTATFSEVVEMAQRNAFIQLTHGAAVYGRPGYAGCKGPYKVQSLIVTRLQVQ